MTGFLVYIGTIKYILSKEKEIISIQTATVTKDKRQLTLLKICQNLLSKLLLKTASERKRTVRINKTKNKVSEKFIFITSSVREHHKKFSSFLQKSQ